MQAKTASLVNPVPLPVVDLLARRCLHHLRKDNNVAKSAKELFEAMCKEAGMSDTETAALSAAASNEKLAPKLDQIIKNGTDDYNAALGRVRALEQRNQQYDDWYKTAQPQYQTAMAELEQLRANAGQNNGGGLPPNFDPSKYMTREDFIASQKERDSRYSAVIKDGLRIASRHAVQFGEELDVDALEKLATERNLPIQVAYDELVKPRRDEKQKAAFEKEKQEFAQQAVKDALSRHKLPVDQVPPEQSPLFRHIPADKVPVDMDSELLAAWHSVGSK